MRTNIKSIWVTALVDCVWKAQLIGVKKNGQSIVRVE